MAPGRGHALPHRPRLHAPPPRRGGLPGGPDARVRRPRALGAFRALEKFRQHMFVAEATDACGSTLALKPMNCPGHVQLYKQGLKRYRVLLLRMAEFDACSRTSCRRSGVRSLPVHVRIDLKPRTSSSLSLRSSLPPQGSGRFDSSSRSPGAGSSEFQESVPVRHPCRGQGPDESTKTPIPTGRAHDAPTHGVLRAGIIRDSRNARPCEPALQEVRWTAVR